MDQYLACTNHFFHGAIIFCIGNINFADKHFFARNKFNFNVFHNLFRISLLCNFRREYLSLFSGHINVQMRCFVRLTLRLILALFWLVSAFRRCLRIWSYGVNKNLSHICIKTTRINLRSQWEIFAGIDWRNSYHCSFNSRFRI